MAITELHGLPVAGCTSGVSPPEVELVQIISEQRFVPETPER
jgi:hypothetical protein